MPCPTTHLFLGDYPSKMSTGWTGDAQGVTHDATDWFFTQTTSLWKVPVAHDLAESLAWPDFSVGIRSTAIPHALRAAGYDHFGDLDHYQGYLFVALSGSGEPAVCIFRAQSLAYVGYAFLSRQSDAPWCAIDPRDGILYSSNGILSERVQDPHAGPMYRYQIDYPRLSQDEVRVVFQDRGPILLEEDGTPVRMRCPQGAVFSDSSGCLYLLNGCIYKVIRHTGGIHVFDMATRRRIARSTNDGGDFKYKFRQRWPWSQEAEGITLWDLDDGRAPGIDGQLHALMLDNNWPDADSLYFKHYRIPPPITIL